MIIIRFFAMLKGLAGRETMEYDPGGPVSGAELKEFVKKEIPALSGVIEGRSVLLAVNRELATDETVVNDGDEVGFLPPFSGG